MHHVLFDFQFAGHELIVTPWKLIGYLGALMFTGRWLVQIVVSRRKRQSVLPRAFWYMSLCGSALLLAYFIVGKNDSVGIITNFFPAMTAGYNLYLDFRQAGA